MSWSGSCITLNVSRIPSLSFQQASHQAYECLLKFLVGWSGFTKGLGTLEHPKALLCELAIEAFRNDVVIA